MESVNSNPSEPSLELILADLALFELLSMSFPSRRLLRMETLPFSICPQASLTNSPALFRGRRKDQADHLTVVLRRDREVRLVKRPLDVINRRFIPRFDLEDTRSGP